MRNHWLKCAYCRKSHPTQTALEACAHHRIAVEAVRYRWDHELNTLNADRPCTSCGSVEHRLCAICAKCGEPAVFNPPYGEPWAEPVSDCCGTEEYHEWDYPARGE